MDTIEQLIADMRAIADADGEIVAHSFADRLEALWAEIEPRTLPRLGESSGWVVVEPVVKSDTPEGFVELAEVEISDDVTDEEAEAVSAAVERVVSGEELVAAIRAAYEELADDEREGGDDDDRK